jgi:hypothetical protein
MVSHGFVRSEHGTITTFDPQGSTQTAPQSININGVAAGSFSDVGSHGFVRTERGSLVTIDFPGGNNTNVWSINGFGAVTGTYQNIAESTLGFVRVPLHWDVR